MHVGLTTAMSSEDVATASSAFVETFSDLYRAEFGRMVRLAVLMVDSRELAEDLVQEAFARLHSRFATVNQPGAYLRTTVMNLCRGELRRRAVRRRHPATESERVAESDDRELLDAVRALSPKRRAVVVLRFYEDQSEADIARLLNMRPGTVKSTLSRALDDLRKVTER
jgi:RNA polymerase sigma factor (sigma-70 family)